ncbi:DNA-3-methyladenine glycosylase family protein [Nakamurella deserti]|uniref:DNA-3-methyladenine glycosylase family protein n=1 Tax=Nakamurella deserti TaxID=2164074 RepID=UPI00197BA0CF|nr:DNA-3-methyladenine glycosylase 2 family protein [Nakamurella deserti]
MTRGGVRRTPPAAPAPPPGPVAHHSTVWRPEFDVDLHRMLRPLSRGRADPSHHRAPDGTLWRASRMTTGPCTYRLRQVHLREVHADAWGPGAEEFIAQLPRMLGADDDLEGFRPSEPWLVDALRRNPGVRILRTHRVLEALIPAILEQKVTGKEAFGEWSWLVRRYGEPAPGPTPVPMWVPPDAATWSRIPSWEWHRSGTDPARSATIMRALQVIGRLEQCVELDHATAQRRLTAVRGIGVWTAAEIAQRALGDPDAVSVGDYHLAGFVGYSLIGEKVDDDRMLELLAPWAGHRYRVIRLLEVSPVGRRPPRLGPRMSIERHWDK